MTHYLQDGDAATDFLKKIPLGRFGKAEEVGDVTLFLASEMSSYITGQVISTCGGLNI
jgi:3-oxoacyl-[acyl-carrier protein] reductase